MADSFNLEFKSTPFEVLNLLQQEEHCVAILPQLFASPSKLTVDPLYVPIDLTDEWNAAFSDSGSQAVTTITLVNRAFLEEHEQAVIEYLNMQALLLLGGFFGFPIGKRRKKDDEEEDAAGSGSSPQA